jgi:hypothetical protein
MREAVVRRDADTVRGLLFALSSPTPLEQPAHHHDVAEPNPNPISA